MIRRGPVETPSKVLLLLTPHEDSVRDGWPQFFNLPPLSLAVLSASLRSRGHEVAVRDLNGEIRRRRTAPASSYELLYSLDAFLQSLACGGAGPAEELVAPVLEGVDLRPFDAVGISLGADFSMFQVHFGFLIGAVLQRRHGKRVIFGGRNVRTLVMFQQTFMALWRVALSTFSHVIYGPGEEAMAAFVERPSGAICGRLYLADGEVRVTTPSRPSVSRPDFTGLDLDLYSNAFESGGDPATQERNLASVYQWPFDLNTFANTVRRLVGGPAGYVNLVQTPYVLNYGCPFRCAFCVESDRQHPVILGDVDRVVDDIEFLVDRHRSPYFLFIDNAFNSSPRFADRFCEQVIKRGVRFYWSDCGRFNNMTEERLIAMREAGCRKITFGLETASRALLTRLNKCLDLAHVDRVLEWCRKHRIWADLEIIVGFPYESEARIRETLDFLDNHRESVNYLAINHFFVVPTSLIGRNPGAYGIELLPNAVTYADVLALAHAALVEGRNVSLQTFQLVRFNELSPPRDFTDIHAAGRRHLEMINNAQRSEFTDLRRMYKTLHDLHWVARRTAPASADASMAASV